MFALDPIVEAKFRAATAKPGISLIRKRCACGKVVTALQLQRCNCCETCRKTAASALAEAA